MSGLDPRARWVRVKRRYSAKVVERDGPNCADCGVETVCSKEHFMRTRRPIADGMWTSDELPQTLRRTIDHVVPLAKGGTNDLENLRVMCAACNTRKGSS